MDEVIARLRASSEKTRQQKFRGGFAAGQQWARHKAEYEELEALSRYQPLDRYRNPTEWQTLLEEVAEGERGSIGRFLCAVITGEPQAGEFDLAALWKTALGENWERLIRHPGFAHGFVEGALEIWEQVAPEL